ncbi:hypothetical protein GCM10023333_35640 [Ferrimonas pelagia]|uniref:Uncharacterized protein n=1 Tax=Ferrimonas pelagia TaxID=1177826 RepID=A0ABP9FE02_9GAMM
MCFFQARHRHAKDHQPSDAWLLLGCRDPEQHWLFRPDFNTYLQQSTISWLYLACFRDQKERID